MKNIIYSIILVLLAAAPTLILVTGNIDTLLFNKVSIFVISLLLPVVIAAILFIFGINKNITSKETDKIIDQKLKQYKPFLITLFWAIAVSTFIWGAYSMWQISKTHNNTFKSRGFQPCSDLRCDAAQAV